MNLKRDSNGLPIIDQLSEEGFVDLTFEIRDFENAGDEYRFHIASSYENRTVGLDVALKVGIKAVFDEYMDLISDHVCRQGAIFRRSGEESDLLVSSICRLYGISRGPLKMVEEETFTVIALH